MVSSALFRRFGTVDEAREIPDEGDPTNQPACHSVGQISTICESVEEDRVKLESPRQGTLQFVVDHG
jgi:hypothetical protein